METPDKEVISNFVENQDKEIASNFAVLKNLLELNLQKSEDIHSLSLDIKRYIKFQQIWSVLRFLLIFVPIVLGFIYLPPIISNLIASYGNLLR